MKDSERLDLLKEIGGTRVYEERRRESLKIMQETGESMVTWLWISHTLTCMIILITRQQKKTDNSSCSIPGRKTQGAR